MKRNLWFWGLIGTGMILLVLSFLLPFAYASNGSIIGGASWPTFLTRWQLRYDTLTWYGAIFLLTAWVIRVKNKAIHRAAMLLVPPALFPGLHTAYSWLNRNFLGPWLGCGCPKKDEFGNLLECQFNANDFSCIFWFVAALGMGVFAFFIGRKIFTKRKWLTAIYVAVILALALIIFRNYCLSMWWG